MECVLCIRRSDAQVFDLPDGQAKKFVTNYPTLLLQRILLQPMFLVPKHQAEHDESFLQLIPYVMFRVMGDVFTYWRGKQAGEQRLHGKKSLGVGGHISQFDIAGAVRPDELEALLTKDAYGNLNGAIPLSHLSHSMSDMVLALGLQRELTEEVGEEAAIFAAQRGKLVAVLHDRSDAVGRVHLGLVYEVNLYDPSILQPGEELADPGWQPYGPDEAFEGWSALITR